MYIMPVSFTGQTRKERYLYGEGPTKRDRYKDLDKELKQACTARKEGIDALNYLAMPQMGRELGVKYFLNGGPAKVKDNPINQMHLRNLFKNFYKLEKIGLCHKSLAQNNVFYAENGKVQIGSMKNAQPYFDSKEKRFIHEDDHNAPYFALPSNADSYELNGLCYYIADFDNDDAECDFVKQYLQEKSSYHELRSDFLVRKGYSPLSPTVVLEDIKSKVFDNPSDEIVEYTKDKLELFALNKKAKSLWDRGNKTQANDAAPKNRFASVYLTLEALRLSAKLNKRTKEFSENLGDVNERYYFALENEYLKSVETQIFNDAQIHGDANFCDPEYNNSKGLFLGSKKDRKQFNKVIDGMDLNNPFFKTNADIDLLVELYKNLINNWSPAVNKINGKDYALSIISV